jgi:transcriptional regulator with XRE-family HTH domain
MTQSTKADCVARIRACLARDGISAVTISSLAGVHPATLRDFERDDWNPKIDTLERIMRVVDGISALDQAA